MANRYISLPLYEEPYFTYSFAAQGQSFVLEFVYNERAQLYYLNLLDDENNPIVQGQVLVPRYPLMEDYAIDPLTGYFQLEEKSDIVSEPYKTYPDKISQYYNFYYVYFEDE